MNVALEKSLQGIAHWISYVKTIYFGHQINEGAIVHELCRMLQSSLSNGEKIKQEIQLKEIVPSIKGKKRVDITIYDQEKKLFCVLEVKRNVTEIKIDEDVLRLATIKQYRPELLCFLVIVVEKNTNNRFIMKREKQKEKYKKLIKQIVFTK